jgi:hypothetical protein
MGITRIFALLIFFFFIFFTSGIIYTNSQELNIEAKKVEYTLPYPGLLPDSPLYIIKAVRDRIVDFLARNCVDKARLYLLNSDKRAASAIKMIESGKSKLAISTMSKAEKYALRMVECMKEIKKQGSQKDENFNLNAKLSNEKHREIIENMLQAVPQGERTDLEEVLAINDQVKQELMKL